MKINLEVRVPMAIRKFFASLNKDATRDAILTTTTGHTMNEHTALAHHLAKKEVKETAGALEDALAQKIAKAIEFDLARSEHESAVINLATIEAALKKTGMNQTTARRMALRVQKSLKAFQAEPTNEPKQ